MQITEEMVEAYVSAMKELLGLYKNILINRDKKSFKKWYDRDCPLCCVNPPLCSRCPWRIITGHGCAYDYFDVHNHYQHIRLDVAKYILLKREMPKNVYAHIQKRVEELEKWIPLYPKKVKQYNEGQSY